MKALSLTLKDLQVLVKDRGSLFQYFLLPLLFVLILSGGLTSIGKSTADTRLPLAVVNQDSGPVAQTLLASIDAAGGLRTELYDLAKAKSMLDENELGRVLFVPPDFSAGLNEGRPVTLRLVAHPDASTQDTQNALLVIQGVASDMTLESQILASLRQMGDMQAGDPAAQQAFSTDRLVAQASSQFERSRTQPLVVVKQTVPTQPGQSEPTPGLGQAVLSGITVLFVFLSAQTAAASIFEEKKVGSFRRLLAAPLSRPALLAGKILPNFLTALVQIVVIFAVGAFVLPALGLGRLGIGQDPFAWALTSVIIALCSTCLGIMIAAIARTEGQISGLSNALLWVAGFLGGALIPAFLLQQTPVLAALSRLVPQYWATTAYYDILARGASLADVLPNLCMLLIFSAVFFFIGVRRFKFE
jgi:ABC-2 type transport system permease protein